MGSRRQRAGRAVMAAAVVAGLGLAGPAEAVPATGEPHPAASSWGRAVAVPGLGALNKGADAEVLSVSCGAGSCAAGGYYSGSSGSPHGFVAVQADGIWGKAVEVPGLAALNKGADAKVESVSCAGRGYCAAGGYYTGSDGFSQQGFVAIHQNGRWAKAIPVPGLRALNTGQDAEVLSVSCARPGSCAAAGTYSDPSGSQGFAASERNGRWGKAIPIPGLKALNKGAGIEDMSVSCAAAGTCAAGGDYSDSSGNGQGFVASGRNGRWGKAIEVPGLGALNKENAFVFSVSCAPAGTCAAGGVYAGHGSGGFAAAERNGHWGKATQIPGPQPRTPGNAVVILSVSCASPGTCLAAGNYGAGRILQGFTAAERNGRWGQGTQIPGLRALNTGHDAGIDSVSCASAGECAAVGTYLARRLLRGFVTVERNGRWGKAIPIPGLATLDAGGDDFLSSVSCAPAGNCAAGGTYLDHSGNNQGFVASRPR